MPDKPPGGPKPTRPEQHSIALKGDVPVLAEDAAQIAGGKEDRAGAVPSSEAVLFAQVGAGVTRLGLAG